LVAADAAPCGFSSVVAPAKMSDFVICTNNDSNPASLILGKVYRRLPDAEAESKKHAPRH